MAEIFQWSKRPDLLKQIETLLRDHSWQAIAYILSQQEGRVFTPDMIRNVCRRGLVTIPPDRVVKIGIRELSDINNQPNNKTEFRDNGNEATLVKYTTLNPQTVDELISVCGVDTDVWKVDRYVVNKWDVSMKQVKNGTVSVITHPNYQIKAWLIRKQPIKHEWPLISPVSVARPKRRTVTKSRGKREHYKALIIPDSQNGYRRDAITGYLDPLHDRRCWDLIVQIARRMKPDVIVLLGDMLDLPSWSDKFLRSPDMYFTTQPALEELFWWLQCLSDTGAEIHYIEGNHEQRVERLVVKNIIESFGLRPANHPDAPAAMSIPNLLSLEDLGISYHGPYPYGEYWFNDNCRASHGENIRKGSGDSVKAIVQESRNSEIVGHIHRVESAHKTEHPRRGPVTYGAYSPGTFARIEPGIVPAGSHRLNWQNGFGEADYTLGNGFPYVYLHNIYGGETLFEGQIMRNRDLELIENELSEATGWDFRRKVD